MSKKFENKAITGYNGKPINIQMSPTESRELDVVTAFWAILNNAPIKAMNDSIQGQRLASALDKAKESNLIAMEEGTHDWFKPLAEQVCPALFRVNGSIVYELVKEGFIKAEPVKSEK